MKLYSLSKRETLNALSTTEGGLTQREAELRLAKYGKNTLKEEKKSSLLALFFAQFKDLMTIILICAACLSAVLAYLTRDRAELVDTAILLFIILLNAFVGVLQQKRADSAIEKLKKLSATTAKVVRDGRVRVVDASELVVGDMIEVEEGDAVPADCRVLECEMLRCDESALTGESKPSSKRDCVVKKNAIAERENTLFFSTFCVSGRARCVVTETGMATEMGAVAKLLKESPPAQTPLDKIVVKLGKIISVTVLSVAGLLFLGGLLSGRVSFLSNLMMAIAVAVAAIPEGMGAVVTIILAMGVQRMSLKRAVMRKLSAVETLGSCTCICSDKTGTLTKNKMSVSSLYSAGEEARLLRCMAICHTVKGNLGAYIGDPTEIALVEYAERKKVRPAVAVVGGIPFSSERKMMSVVAKDSKARVYLKGAVDVLLKKCTRVATAQGSTAVTAEKRAEIMQKAREYSASAMRVLAFAEREYDGELQEEGLIFLGLVALFDPPKEGAKEAVLACRRAGVKTVMITGDGAETAFEIARRLQIAKEREEVLTGEEIDALSEEEFARQAERYSVFARVSPKHKLSIVKALQKNGETVAMTGDGVNDAPSVRIADIGVAMGSGTDVTKNASDMVIADDNFATMVGAVEEGRNVFYNIKRTISFFLSTNLAEVFAVLFVSLFLWKYDFLTSTQLLWINLITDSLPVLALGMGKTAGTMQRPPVSIDEIFCKRSLVRIFFFGAIQTAIVVFSFVFGLNVWGNGVASTCAFLVLSFLELFYAFNVKKERGRTKWKEFISDKPLLLTVALGVLVNVLLVGIPFLAELFDLTVLNARQWLFVFACSLFVIPLGEVYKAVEWRAFDFRVKRRKKRTLARGNAR